MRRSKAQPLQPVDLVHRFEQLHKRTFIVDLRKFAPAVQIHNLSEQRDFLHSLRDQVANFAHNFINGTAALRATRLWDDAEGATHVAALHDRNESGRLPRCELLLANCRLRAALFGDIDDRETQIVHWEGRTAGASVPIRAGARPSIFLRDKFFHIVSDAMESLSPDDEVDMRQILQQRLATGLRHAAKETEYNVRPLFCDAAE